MLELGADLLVLEGLLRLEAELGAGFHARLVDLRPVDDADRVVRLGIVRIEFGGLAIVLLGLIELLHVQVQITDSFDASDVFRVLFEDRLVGVDRLLGHAVVIFGVGARNVLLGIGGSQIEPGVEQAGVKRNRLLEVVNRFFVTGVLISLHAFVQLVAGFQPVAAGSGDHRQAHRHQYQHPCVRFHRVMRLPWQSGAADRWGPRGQNFSPWFAPDLLPSMGYWPDSIFAVISPTLSTPAACAMSIALATSMKGTLSSPFTNITFSARVL